MNNFGNSFTKSVGIKYPIICGAMYPCSNPELVAAVSEVGGIGIIQPLSFVYVHNYNFKNALEKIKLLTSKPVGMNIITEKSSKIYLRRMNDYLETALEFGIKFFISSLGNPNWIVEKVKPFGGIVYHDVTERKWAEKAISVGVDGLICVNNRAGGHAGNSFIEELYNQTKDFNLPLICAGGIGSKKDFLYALQIGYSGVQMGTRFIASKECSANLEYKNAIVNSTQDDIVLSEKVTGVPLSIINTPYVKKVGTKAGFIPKLFLQNRKLKHIMRAIYTLLSAIKLKKSNKRGDPYKDYFQAGKSVDGINSIMSVKEIIDSFVIN
ncbi:MAG: nitronate monooxygenase family protein [Bacteroidetes bacterium]|nr:nitronate monooxygenase family protein [Bacteroidota bacterium]